MEMNMRQQNCATVSDARMMPICENYPFQHPYAKIPVVLAEFTVQIDCEATITLDEPAIEIKRVKKNVYLEQCRLIAGTDKLFLKGFVRKNIEYATNQCNTETGIGGDIRHSTVYVPFECVTKIEGISPNFWPNIPGTEYQYFSKKCIGRDPKETDRYNNEYFNEKIFCELEYADIYEADITNYAENDVECPIDVEFQEITEKMVIYLTLKLLQKQQVNYHHGDCIANEKGEKKDTKPDKSRKPIAPYKNRCFRKKTRKVNIKS